MRLLNFTLGLIIFIGIIVILFMLFGHVFGQDWRDFVNKTSPYCCFFLGEAYGQNFNDPNAGQYNNQQFGNDQFSNNQQFGQNQQFDQNQGGFGQGFNNQYQQQPYGMNQQYGTPSYGPYPQQYGQQPYGNPYQVGGFGIQEIITALVAGGGSAAYARRKTNSLENDKQVMMAEILKGKQIDAELARLQFQNMPQKGAEITDAPTVKLQTLQQDVQDFTDKTAKA